MTETLDAYTGGTSEEDFAEPDLPDDIAGPGDGEDAPWGYTTDPETGRPRPKKAPGRPRKQLDAEELEKQPPVEHQPDQVPARPTLRRPQKTSDDEKAPPMPRGSVIAKGINKMYRRAGKVIRGFEHGDEMGIGQAFIECTRIDPDTPDDERELTVGEAWEQLARSNPRIRAFLLKVIAGGDIGDLIMAHAPIGVALVMKPWVQRLIPFESMAESLTEPDEDEPEGTAVPGGLTREDIQQMQDLTAEQAQQIARVQAQRMGIKLTEADVKQVASQVKQAADGQTAVRRQQPKKQTRAQRTGTSR